MTTASLQGGSNSAVALTLAGRANHRHHIYQLTWSYSDTPTGGQVSTTGLEGDQLDFDITAGGPGGVPLPPIHGSNGSSVIITLAAGGGSVVGKLTIFYETIPIPGGNS